MKRFLIFIFVVNFSLSIDAQEAMLPEIDQYYNDVQLSIDSAKNTNAGHLFCDEFVINKNLKKTPNGNYYQRKINFWYTDIPDPEAEDSYTNIRKIEEKNYDQNGVTSTWEYLYMDGMLTFVKYIKSGSDDVECWYYDHYSFICYTKNKKQVDPEKASTWHEGIVNNSQDLTSLFHYTYK